MHEILVHVREPGADTLAVQHALKLAATTGSALTGLYAAPLYFGSAIEPALAAALIEETRRLVAAALAAKQAFVDRATTAGVPRVDWLVAEGSSSEALAQVAPRHDLLVLDHAAGDTGPGSDVPGIVLRTGIACLVLPREPAALGKPARIAIGWNGSAEAMRAMHAAASLLPGAEVLLMQGEERERYPGLGWYPPFVVADWLGARGAQVTAQTITERADAAGGALLARAEAFGADLLVMGAYGRGRLSEWVLGGATRDVLRLARMPLLLHH